MDSDSQMSEIQEPVIWRPTMTSTYPVPPYSNQIFKNQPYRFIGHNRFSQQTKSRTSKAASDSIATSKTITKKPESVLAFRSGLKITALHPAHPPVAQQDTQRAKSYMHFKSRKISNFQSASVQNSKSNSPLPPHPKHRPLFISPRDVQELATPYPPKSPIIPTNPYPRYNSPVQITASPEPLFTPTGNFRNHSRVSTTTVDSTATFIPQPPNTRVSKSRLAILLNNGPKLNPFTTNDLPVQPIADDLQIPAPKLTQLTDRLSRCRNVLEKEYMTILETLQTKLKDKFHNFQPKTEGYDLGFKANRNMDNKLCYVKLYINRQAQEETKLYDNSHNANSVHKDQEILYSFQTYSKILGTHDAGGFMPNLIVEDLPEIPLSIVESEHLETQPTSAEGAITDNSSVKRQFKQLNNLQKTQAYNQLLQIMYATLATGIHDVRSANIKQNSIIDLVSPMEQRAAKLFNTLPPVTKHIDQDVNDYLYILNQKYLRANNPQAASNLDQLLHNSTPIASIIKRFIYINSVPLEYLKDTADLTSPHEIVEQLKSAYLASNSDSFMMNPECISPIWTSKELIQNCNFTEMLKLLQQDSQLVENLNHVNDRLTTNLTAINPEHSNDFKLRKLQQLEINNTQNRLQELQQLVNPVRTTAVPVSNTLFDYTLPEISNHIYP